MVDVKSDVIFQGLDPGDIFRPNLAAEIDDTRTWVSPEGYRLSDRLWLAKERDRAQIEKVLRTGLAQGDSPLTTAKRLESLLNPQYQLRRDPETFRVLPKAKQPKGVATTTPRQGPGKGPERPRNSGTGSYAARRLARTETTRAFGAAAIRAGKANPLMRRMRWRMSAHHHDSDQCDQNAAQSSKGEPRGVYLLDELPQYPDHPHEMCTLNPYVTQEDIDDAIPRLRRAMQDGDFSEAGLFRPFTAPPPPATVPATPVAPGPLNSARQNMGDTKEDIAQWLVDNRIAANVQFGDIPLKAARETAERLALRHQQYGHLWGRRVYKLDPTGNYDHDYFNGLSDVKFDVSGSANGNMSALRTGPAILRMNKDVDSIYEAWDYSQNYGTRTGTPWSTKSYGPREDSLVNVVDHELGHLVDAALDSKQKGAYTKAVKAATKDGWKPPSAYANTKREEQFAENWAVYVMGRKDLLSPQLVTFFDDLVGGK